MALAVHGILIWALFLGGGYARGQGPEGGAQGQTSTPVTLTNDHPEGSFLIAPEVLTSPPPVLALAITQVVNPNKTAFQLFVYLSYQPGAEEKRSPVPAKILVGNVGSIRPTVPEVSCYVPPPPFASSKRRARTQPMCACCWK